MKAITPAEAQQHKQDKIPVFVYEVFNALIKEAFDGKSALIWQNDVLAKLLEDHKVDRNDAFNNHWLDVEFKYREAGWLVTYGPDGHSGAYYNFNKK